MARTERSIRIQQEFENLTKTDPVSVATVDLVADTLNICRTTALSLVRRSPEYVLIRYSKWALYIHKVVLDKIIEEFASYLAHRLKYTIRPTWILRDLGLFKNTKCAVLIYYALNMLAKPVGPAGLGYKPLSYRPDPEKVNALANGNRNMSTLLRVCRKIGFVNNVVKPTT